MKISKHSRHLLLAGVSMIVTACSAVNSMEPFDDKQAAIIAREMLPPSSLAKRHQLPVQRKAQQSTNQNNDSSKS